MANPELPNIDPSLEEHLEDVVKRLTEGSVPAPFFGDAVIVEQPDTVKLPGESPIEAHRRLQREGGTQE